MLRRGSFSVVFILIIPCFALLGATCIALAAFLGASPALGKWAWLRAVAWWVGVGVFLARCDE